MDKVFSSFLCCGGEQESSKPELSTAARTQQSSKTSTASTTQTQQPRPKSQPSPTPAMDKQEQKQEQQQEQQQLKHKAATQQLQKTDVTVYEGTDSTVETSDNVQGTTTTRALTDDSSSSNQQVGYSLTNTSSRVSNDGDDEDEEMLDEDEDDDFFDLTRLQPGQSHAPSGWLLDPAPEHLKYRKCLILDLDETLVHSSFKYMRQADFVIPVDIENQLHNVYVIKRPGVDEFMKRVGELYEVVVFTASVSRYGDPLLDALDIHKSVHHRLFRDSCYNYQGNYIKNLSQIGRPLQELIILDNSPASYIFHPQHAIPISSWFSDAHDNELLDIIPFLEDLAKENVEDVGLVLDINL